MTEPNHDTDCTDEIVCPYCGHSERDSWECSQDTIGTFEHECNECGEVMMTEREMSITYSTWKKPS